MGKKASVPKVSVVIPTHNMARYLPVAIDSALGQGYPNIEIIVVDDGSTDDTAEVLRPYLSHIRCIHQEQRGLSGARNRALEVISGEYVRLLDADDALCPDTLSRQAELLDRYPRVALVHGQAHIVDSGGNVRGLRKSRLPNGAATVLPSARAFRRLLRGNDICVSTAMVRMTALQRVGPFQRESFPGEDWDMWLRITAYYDQAYIPKPLAYYRVHGRSITAGYTLSSFLNSHLHTLRTLFARPDLPYPEQEKLAYACLDRNTALLAARLRQRGPFIRYLTRALRRHPSLFLERGTWSTLYEGAKLLVPMPALEAARRFKGKVLVGGGRQERWLSPSTGEGQAAARSGGVAKT
jgi:glycosyltransferase involved in cell wall biosynthesis